MINYLEHKRGPLRFCVPAARVVGVSVERGKVVGQWEDAHPAFSRVKSEGVLRRFANCSSDPQQILRFTKAYGPLTVPVVGRGRRFSFSLDEWLRAQQAFRLLWDERMESTGRSYLVGGRSVSFKVEKGEELEFVFGQWRYVTSTLERCLDLELRAMPQERLRLCEKKSCKTRYFIARHGRQKYCSERCAAWAQRLAKAEWASRNYVKRPRRAIRGKGTKKK